MRRCRRRLVSLEIGHGRRGARGDVGPGAGREPSEYHRERREQDDHDEREDEHARASPPGVAEQHPSHDERDDDDERDGDAHEGERIWACGLAAGGPVASPVMGDRIRITEVAPRDGLQNEPGVIATEGKIALVLALMESGVDEIEVSSFVSRRWIPQLGDAAEVFAGIAHAKRADVELSALVPNEKGLEAAIGVNQGAGGRLIDKVSVFAAASETFSRRNINATIDESIERFVPVIDRAAREGLRVRGYVSCAIACPFEGPIDPERVAEVAVRLLDLGIHELDLGDTIGAGEPASVRRLIEVVSERAGSRLGNRSGQNAGASLVMHLHDTFGRAAACAKEAFRLGVRSFDGAVGGLGGCPYASTSERRAPGNIDTEVLVRALGEVGATTVIDPSRLAEARTIARTLVGSAKP